MVDDVAAIAEETSAESETVAAAAEEQTTALTEVSQSADDLAGRAGHLSATLESFDTDETVDEEPVPALEVGGGADAGDVDEGANPNGDDGEVDDHSTSDGPDDARSDDAGSDGSDTADSSDRSDGDDPFDETFTFEQVDDET